MWAGLRMLLWYPLLMLYAGDVLAKIQFYLVQSKQVCYTACARTAKFHAKLQKKPVRILDSTRGNTVKCSIFRAVYFHV